MDRIYGYCIRLSVRPNVSRFVEFKPQTKASNLNSLTSSLLILILKVNALCKARNLLLIHIHHNKRLYSSTIASVWKNTVIFNIMRAAGVLKTNIYFHHSPAED